jgi:hypothetical protein
LLSSSPPGEPADRVFFFTWLSPAHKVPIWAEQLGSAAPCLSRFCQDRDLASPSAADRDYRFSGFHRGHLAPAADFASPEAVPPSCSPTQSKVILLIQGDSAVMFAAIVPNQDNLPASLDQFAVTVE